MGTPETGAKKFGIWEKLELLKRGAEIGKRVRIEDMEEVMDLTAEIVMPFVKQLDKPIFPKGFPKEHCQKRGVLVFETKIITIWLQRSGEWFSIYRYPNSSKEYSYDSGISTKEIAEAILKESNRFLEESFVGRAKEVLKELPFMKNLFLYYIIPLNFVTQSFNVVEKAIEKKREQLLGLEELLGFLDEFTQSLDPLTCREKKLSLEGYSIFSDTKNGESHDTSDYFTLDDFDPFWKTVGKRAHQEEYHLNAFKRDFDSLDSLIRHLGYVIREIKDTPESCDSAEKLFGRTSGRLPLSEGEKVKIKKIIESI